MDPGGWQWLPGCAAGSATPCDHGDISSCRVQPSPPRFYQPEHSLMRQTVHMKGLPGTDAVFAGGALRNLAVACSHPDIIAGAGSSGLVGGAERDEVWGREGAGALCGEWSGTRCGSGRGDELGHMLLLGWRKDLDKAEGGGPASACQQAIDGHLVAAAVAPGHLGLMWPLGAGGVPGIFLLPWQQRPPCMPLAASSACSSASLLPGCN